MKSIFFLVLALPVISTAQKIKLNAYDKFIRQKRVESYPLTIRETEKVKMSIAFEAIGSTCYIKLSGYGTGANVIGAEDKAILLFANDSVAMAKSVGLQSIDVSKTPAHYKHLYVIPFADLQKLSLYRLSALRKYYQNDFDDIYLSTETGDKLIKLCSLFLRELQNPNASQPVLAIALKDVPRHVGDSVSFVTRISSGRYFPHGKDAPTVLNAAAASPEQPLTVIIPGADRNNFGAEPERFYSGKKVRISGKVQRREGELRIVVRQQEQLVPVPDPEAAVEIKIAPPVTKEAETATDTTAVPPTFPGGFEVWMNFLTRNLKPPSELAAGEEKTVVVQFFVKTDGAVDSFQIRQSAGASFDNEVLRVLKRMPPWKAAVENGRPVDAVVTQPITFFRLGAPGVKMQ